MSKTKFLSNKTNLITFSCYFVVTVACVVVCIFAKNLFLQFTLTCISFFSAYNIIVFLIYFLTFTKIQPKIIIPSPIIALSQTVIQLILPKKFLKLPCVSLRLMFKLSDNQTSTQIQGNLVLDKKNSAVQHHVIGKVSFECGRHGEFTMENVAILVCTYFSAIGFRFHIDYTKLLPISPIENVLKNHESQLSTGDETGNYKKTLQTSTDFFDNRKYYIGDDPRRINWKIFAHINELQIRQAEKIATNFGNQNIIFAPFSRNLAEYEAVTAIFVDICNDLIKKDIKLNIYLGSSEKPKTFDKITADKLGTFINTTFYPTKNVSGVVKQIATSALIIGSIGELNNILMQIHPTSAIIYTSSILVEMPQSSNPWLYINNSEWLAKDMISLDKQKKLAISAKHSLETLKNQAIDNNLIIIGD